MAILEVLKDPHPLLRQKSVVVDKIDADFKEFTKSLLETMYSEKTIGIAAIQVGNPVRALIIDIPHNETDESGEMISVRKPLFIINPEITYLSKETVVLTEACLSVKKDDGISSVKADVERYTKLHLTYTDLDGAIQKIEIDGNASERDLLFARVLQHEVDHLDGILFIDKIYHEVIASTSPLHNEI